MGTYREHTRRKIARTPESHAWSTGTKHALLYLQVLVPGQRHGSGLLLGHTLPGDGAVVADDGLDSGLIVHVHDELLTAYSRHHIRPGLVSSIASEEILHTKTMYPYIISRICNKCDLLNNIVR